MSLFVHKEISYFLSDVTYFSSLFSFVLPFLTILLHFLGHLFSFGSLVCYLSPAVSPPLQTHCQTPDILPVPAPLPRPCPILFLHLVNFFLFPALFCALPRDPWLPSLPVFLALPPVWALVPVCSFVSLRSGICPCCTPDALLSLPRRPGAGSPATASTGKMGSLCSRAWARARAWTCSSWAAMGMKGVLGSSVPRLARAPRSVDSH